MSITLDVNNFLQNELPGLLDGTTTASTNNSTAAVHQKATSKMEAILHKELEQGMAEPREDAASIFDEIENFLKLNKFMDSNGNLGVTEQSTNLQSTAKTKASSLPQTPKKQQPPPQPITISSPGLEFQEFTLPHCVSSHFLLPDETHNLQELDPQLFSVEDDQLLPITSPFMVPGIYKKLSNALSISCSRDTPGKSNVFITVHEKRGCVVGAARFQELYVCGDANGEPPESYVKANQRPVLLLEALEAENSDEDEVQVKPTLGFNCGSRIPKQWDALSKLAYEILKLSNRDPIVIDHKRNEIVRTNNETSRRTIYRFLSPEKFGLKPHQNQIISLPEVEKSTSKKAPTRKYTRLGRPHKRVAEQGESNVVHKSPKQRKTEQFARESEKSSQESMKPSTLVIETKLQRTRFGRIVRNRQIVANSELRPDDANDPPPIEDSVDFIQNFLTDLKDSDFRCSRPISPLAAAKEDNFTQPATSISASSESSYVDTESSSPEKRKIPPESVCPTCNKIFLGRRMKRHYVQHPDHMQLPAISQATSLTPPPPSSHIASQSSFTQPNDEMSLFRFLVSKLQRTHLSEDQRADLFLNEINDLVTQLQLRSSRLIRNTSGLHFVSARCSRVLCIPEGHYALDMMAIENEAPPPPPIEPAESSTQPCILNFEHLSSSALPAPPATARNLDYTALSMSLDDTLTDEAAQKLNLSAGGKLLPPSEESLLRTVGDLVHDGMQKLQQQSDAAQNLSANMSSVPIAKSTLLSTLVPPGIHYDHASDNAVEAVNMKETIAVPQAAPILGLSVDFFQFNND